jgi:ketosteroid isomerase-like protein
MKNIFAIRIAVRTMRTAFLLFLAAALLLACASPAAAQQKDKKKKKDSITPTDSSGVPIPMSDEKQIDYLLSEMLGAWQIGDVEKLHKDYADDVSIVNGSWAPPIIGWTNYLAIYQQQRARMQQVRLDRSNTFIKVSGTVAWACYQWEFAGVVDGQPNESRGHTTVVLEKRNNHWVIAHNHTSLVETAQPAAPTSTPTPQPQPQKPPAP